MRRRYLILLVALLLGASVDAQIARWLVQPQYDSIQVQDNGLYVAMKDGTSFLIKDGETIFSESGIDICDFREGKAVALVPGTNKLAGILDEEGYYINFSEYNYYVDTNYPYYSDGWLLLNNGAGYYYFASKDGVVSNGPYAEAWPFSCGVAAVKCFRDLDKPNADRTTWCYFDTELKEVALPDQTDNRDIEFLSSLSDDKGIVVVKKTFKLYDKKLHQFLALNADTLHEKKKEKPVPVTTVPTGVVPVQEEDIWRITARNAEMRFDARRRPLNIVYPVTATRKDRVVNKFHPVDYMSPEPETDLEVFSDEEAATRRGNQYGLLLLLPRDTVELLPPQLKAITDLHGDRAVVQSSKTNLFGVLQVERDQDFRFSLNDGKQVGFLHETYDTSLKLIFPRLLQDKTVVVESPDKHIDIKKDTKGYVINDEVCSLSYDCLLRIPSGEDDMGIDDHIVDDGSSQYVYTLYVNYDGLRSRDYHVGLDQWYMKNYSVKLGTITAESINFEIMQEQNSTGFYKDIEAEIFDADSVRQAHLTLGNGLVKNTENRLVAMLDDVKASNYTLHVTIKEGRCPQVYFDFPIANKATKVVERQAEIEKKECVKCHKQRALNQFSNGSDICAICVKASSQPTKPVASTAHVVVPPKKDNTRVCAKCKKKKSLSQFSRNSNICKSCVF